MHFLCLLLLPLVASAQYFSDGWQPGQPVHTTTHPAPVYTPGPAQITPPEPKRISDLFNLNNILTSSPVASLFQHLGINITERVEATKVKFWDERIPLITDSNYEDLIVNEPLTDQEERDRVWVVVISVTASKQDGISKYLDHVFDSAYNETVNANDLPHVRWGRIDYLNVTYLTTKWNVWQAPYLMIITDRGQTLRFYKPYQLRLRENALREFLLNGHWENTPTWESRYAPGGDREWIMHHFATYLTRIYDTIILVPRWLFFMLTGGLASIIISFLHRPSKAQMTRQVPVRPESAAEPVPKPEAPVKSEVPEPSVGAKAVPKPEVPVKVEESESSARTTTTPKRTRKTRSKKN